MEAIGIAAKETTKDRRKALCAMLAFMLLCYFLLHSLFGGTLLDHCAWDSYSLQAQAWLEGRTDLGQNYTYLELAIYNGKYYVSFPPFPSVVMLPFVLIFGTNTPNNLIIMVITLLTAAAAFTLCGFGGYRAKDSALLALFITFGSNVMWMSTMGGVWFMAQIMMMLLLLLAATSACKNRICLSYALVALAVGCRPFAAAAFLPLAAWFYAKNRSRGMGKLASFFSQWKAWIAPAAIAAAMMWYNCIRFDNPLEFGHNYLPEFLESENGQFNLTYIWDNIVRIFRPVTLNADLSLSYSYFDGFMFFVANPLFLLFFASVWRSIRQKNINSVRVCLCVAMAVMLFGLCLHKTFGGWQFGARYTCDLLPLALCHICMSSAEKRLKGWEKAAAVFGIAFNIYGALAMTFQYGS